MCVGSVLYLLSFIWNSVRRDTEKERNVQIIQKVGKGNWGNIRKEVKVVKKRSVEVKER
jgi:hypothetical protein